MRDAALYERQVALELSDPSVSIVGCGGVGVWAALALVLGGASRLSLFDADEISLHNLNRLPFPSSAVGQPKSLALAGWLQSLRPGLEIEARGKWDAQLHSFNTDWVVCCTDSLRSRRAIHSAATYEGLRYLELGADGERWTLSAEPPQFSTELEDEPGYATVPVHVGPCMMAGAAAAYYVLHDRVPDGDHIMQWRGGRLDGAWYGQAQSWPAIPTDIPSRAEANTFGDPIPADEIADTVELIQRMEAQDEQGE